MTSAAVAALVGAALHVIRVRGALDWEVRPPRRTVLVHPASSQQF